MEVGRISAAHPPFMIGRRQECTKPFRSRRVSRGEWTRRGSGVVGIREPMGVPESDFEPEVAGWRMRCAYPPYGAGDRHRRVPRPFTTPGPGDSSGPGALAISCRRSSAPIAAQVPNRMKQYTSICRRSHQPAGGWPASEWIAGTIRHCSRSPRARPQPVARLSPAGHCNLLREGWHTGTAREHPPSPSVVFNSSAGLPDAAQSAPGVAAPSRRSDWANYCIAPEELPEVVSVSPVWLVLPAGASLELPIPEPPLEPLMPCLPTPSSKANWTVI